MDRPDEATVDPGEPDGQSVALCRIALGGESLFEPDLKPLLELRGRLHRERDRAEVVDGRATLLDEREHPIDETRRLPGAGRGLHEQVPAELLPDRAPVGGIGLKAAASADAHEGFNLR